MENNNIKIQDKKKMNAITITKYGAPEVLKLRKKEIPIPKSNEVLVRNYGSSINTVDVLHRGGKAPKVTFWGLKLLIGFFLRLSFGGLIKPKQKIPGFSFAGEVVSLGKEVSDWKEGDKVYGYSPSGGACAQYMTVIADVIAKKPINLSFQEAAAVPGGASPSLVAFRDLARPKKDQKVLIIGASGGNGTFGIQIAKQYGAHVTAICGPSNTEMVKKIGADCVIDYTKEDFTTSNQKYDIIYDAIGVSALSKCSNNLTEAGIYITNNPTNSLRNIFGFGSGKKKLKSPTADESADALSLLREWIESGKIKPVIDTVYPLSQTAKAHLHYETGHSKGRIVISID
ncbi:NAD(P)-dependent alcohol dehydrogenase [Promethearchaeum syntrophicum]|uniref:NAD(P)-dependent alcohol dehydrogenase n=1 Tax=Promethearchaeum syntrophicum TaxID=2594042 RepID=A0A5B9DAU0_9ARCH|nr:NAD(P)-dependent alcohol dehydrogenase [Candidatus Prometheoarchaeum syntrophicum]